jgi:hypothetical protein
MGFREMGGNKRMAMTQAIGRRLYNLLRIRMGAMTLFALCTGAAFAQGTPSQDASEYQLKAAFLLNFGRFTEWPVTAFKSGSVLNLCVLGKDPFGEDLDKIVRNQSVQGRQIQILRLSDSTDLAQCQILYLSLSEKSRFRQILDLVSKNGVLTVSDAPGFVESGGMIQLYVEGQHVHFAINAGAAQSAGLKISSKLMQIAKAVGDAGR